MYKFKAEFNIDGSFGTRIAMADTIDELLNRMEKQGFNMLKVDKKQVLKFKDSNQYRLYGWDYTLQRGETEMTEYTSF